MDLTAYPHSISFGNGNANCNNVTNSHNSIVNVNKVIADDSPEIMQWLSPLDPRRRHHDVRTDRVDGVGNWLLETNEFREWRGGEGGGDNAVLFCCGDPGVGKTYLSSLVIDNLCDELCEGNIAIAMFYCDFRDQEEQTTTNIIGAILKQLLVRGEVLERVRKAFQKAKTEAGGRGLRLPDMVQMLKQAVAILPQVFICVDALDECPPKHLLELLRSMKDVIQESSRTRIFLTGRPQVEAEITRYFITKLTIPIIPKTHDIKIYLENKLEMDPETMAMSVGLHADILRIIPERVSDIFLLVSLNIDAILGEVTISGRRRKLNEMTKGNHLGDAYAATLDRMKAQKEGRSALGMGALMWVSNSERPLHASELCHALGVKIGSIDLDHENVPEIRTILRCALGLIVIEASSSTVRLVHFTLQEYLSNNPSLLQSPPTMIAEVCLTYLNFRCIRELPLTLDSTPPILPFIEYTSCYWGKHIRREKTECMSSLALELLIGFEQHISSRLLLLHYHKNSHWWGLGLDRSSYPNGFTGLHGAASLGIGEMVAALLATKECDINATDATGRTALSWAAIGGHEDVVRLLLQQRDVNANTIDIGAGRTPLLWAVQRRHHGVVKSLLERGDIDPNATDIQYDRTPLSWAAGDGDEEVVKLLLEREGINPNAADTKYGQTPLLWAASGGHEGVVKLLLEIGDVNLNAADTQHGRTPLWWAAVSGHQGVVNLLLRREDINPNTADTEYGQTPLWWATERGHEGIVKLLLERVDIKPNTADTEYGQTPLRRAALRGYEGVVRLLLGREDINPNVIDTQSSQTPLFLAAELGYEGVVKLLLERKDINPNVIDVESGRTPLFRAAELGYEGVVKLLLERKDINPNSPDTEYGLTQLCLAANSGCEKAVKLLLERGNINPNAADTKYGQTPLLWATSGGCEGAVKLLLERDDVDPNIADTQYGLTPLWLATQRGYEGIVKLLLEAEDTDPNTADTQYGLTPLLLATQRKYEGAVKLLLEREDTNPNSADTKYGRTPLILAASCGHERIVKLLLERWDINPYIPDLSGDTALKLAVSQQHAGVVQLLSEHELSLPPPWIRENPKPPPTEAIKLTSKPLSAFPVGLTFTTTAPSPDTRLLLVIALLFFVIISFLFIILYFLSLIAPSSSAVSPLPIYRRFLCYPC